MTLFSDLHCICLSSINTTSLSQLCWQLAALFIRKCRDRDCWYISWPLLSLFIPFITLLFIVFSIGLESKVEFCWFVFYLSELVTGTVKFLDVLPEYH